MTANRRRACRPLLVLVALAGVVPPANAAPNWAGKLGVRIDDFGDPLPPGAVARMGTVRPRQPSEVCSVVFSPDGKLLATGGRYDGVRLWGSATGKLLRFFPANGGQGIFYLSFSPDGSTLVSSGTDGALEVWSVAAGTRVVSLHIAHLRDPSTDVLVRLAGTGQELLKFQRQAGAASAACISPDGKLLAIADLLASIRLYQTATGTKVAELDVPGTAYHRLAFTPDGRALAAVDHGGRLRLLEVATGKPRHVLADLGDPDSFVFSANGDILAVCESCVVELWDALSGRKLGRLVGHTGWIKAAAFVPGTSFLATASEDTTILLWDVAGLIRQRKTVALTPEALASAWKDLAAPDAAQAYRAMAALRQDGPQAVAFLGGMLKPQLPVLAKDVERWLKDLDDARFAVRDQAAQELKKHFDGAAPALRKALAAKTSLEMQRRLTLLLERAEEGRWLPEALRTLRAIELLEHIGSPEARAVLQTLADGAPDARLTREAKASLERLRTAGT
jgi:hypothetical protein